MAIKYRCDRCQKEVNITIDSRVYELPFYVYPEKLEVVSFVLCNWCAAELAAWLQTTITGNP